MLDKKLVKLVKRATKGDRKAFARICEIKSKDILYICIHLMGNYHDGEDAAQEIILYMQNNISKLKSPEAFKVWMYQITRSVCIDMARKRTRRMIMNEETEYEAREEHVENLPYESALMGQKKEKIFEIIDELPEQCKICILLFYYEDMSYEEIARVLGIAKKDVDNTLYKAKKLIKRKLDMEVEAKQLLSKTYAAAPLPVLGQLLRAHSEEVLTKEMLQGVKCFGAHGASGMTARMTIGLVTTVSTVAVGTAVYNHRDQEVPDQYSSPAVVEEAEVPQAEAESIIVEEEIDIEIETLEDMIGTEEAEILRNWTGTTGSRQEIIAFLMDQELEQIENIMQPGIQQEDTLYCLEKGTKQLQVITRYSIEQNTAELAYWFTDAGEELPRAFDIVFCFDEWRESEGDSNHEMDQRTGIWKEKKCYCTFNNTNIDIIG